MKRRLAAALCLAICLVSLALVPQNACAQTDWQSSEAYTFMRDFVQNNPSRFGEIKEKDAAEYLKACFDALLKQFGQSQSQLLQFNTESGKVCDVKATIHGQSNKEIIIGAHFDAQGEGASDNAGGVTALYLTMKQLLQTSSLLPFNVTFVAFGGEERGLLGSQAYVDNLSTAERENILVMFNMDTIVNGDNFYLLCEGKRTDLADVILSSYPCTLKEKPYARGTYAIDYFGYGYYDMAQASDHTPFRLAGIPTAMLFSGNYVAWDYLESTDPDKCTMNTSKDTFDYLVQTNGEQAVSRINDAVAVVCSTLTNPAFVDVAHNARKQLVNLDVTYNVWWPLLVVLGVVIILAVLAVLYCRRLDKRSVLGTSTVKTSKVFSAPDADEIFSFDDNAKKNQEIEDIFSTKK